VIGGAQIYTLALPRADELLLTEIDRDFQGTTHFPAWPREAFEEVGRESHAAAPPNDFGFAWVRYRRRP
jgi:dihydrofolate reductase